MHLKSLGKGYSLSRKRIIEIIFSFAHGKLMDLSANISTELVLKLNISRIGCAFLSSQKILS